MDKNTMARDLILDELRRRWREGAIPIGVKAPADISRFHQPQKNYFCGEGKMACPICNIGELRYSRSCDNGHVHALCNTDGCVNFRE
jgi:hypothetical protein